MDERQKLINRLMDAVKQCQIRFGGRKNVATASDSTVCCLCQQLENVLQHGLKQQQHQQLQQQQQQQQILPRVASTTIRQICDAVSDGLKLGATEERAAPVFWCIVRHCLTRDEFERYVLLVNVRTDLGRARAWLRSSLNESSLQRYMHSLVDSGPLIGRYYESWAVMADPECTAMLPHIVAGLSSILFAIGIDHADLDTPLRVKPQHNNNNNNNGAVCCTTLAGAPGSAEPRAVLCANPVAIRSTCDNSDAPNERRRQVRRTHIDSPTETLALTMPDSSGAIEAIVAHDSTLTDSSDDGDRSAGSSTRDPGPAGDGGSISRPLEQAGSCTTSSACAESACVSEAGSLTFDDAEHVSAQSKMVSTPAESSRELKDATCLTEAELRSALQSVTAQKRYLHEQLACVKQQLSVAEHERDALQTSVISTKQCYEERLIKLDSEKLAMQCENAELKKQLQCYVAAVQMLRTDQQTPHQILQQIEQQVELDSQATDSDGASAAIADNQTEAEMYEKKLVQVAEMHAELMEFNSRLCASLNEQRRRSAALRHKLRQYRRTAGQHDATLGSSDSSDDTCDHVAPRVHVWVPCVFLTTTDGRSHHMYQVFVRVCSDEWSVYHRYSSFYQLYRRLRKLSHEIKAFDFPPRQAINRTGSRVAENRRGRLQQFLQCVLRYLMRVHHQLTTCPSRAALQLAEPFFAGCSGRLPNDLPIGAPVSRQ